MHSVRRTRFGSLVRALALAGLACALAQPALAQPKAKARPVTRAELDRLEAKLEDQQRVIDRLIRLHQQYLQSLSAALDNPAATGAAAEPRPLEAKADDTPADARPADARPADARPADARPADARPADARPVAKVEAKVAPRPETRVEPRPRPVKPAGAGTVVGKVAGASDAVIYIEDIVVAGRGSATMKQQGKQFVPQVLVVQKGTTVQFPNADAFFHNVFSVTPDNSFDLGSFRQGESRSVTLRSPGVVSVYCNMHPQMVGYILVVPNGNYVRAGHDGFFRLANVPAGKHRIVAWAPNAKPVVAEADVSDGEVVTVELALKKGRMAPHVKKDGLPYGSYDK